jgi:hypothetical protein
MASSTGVFTIVIGKGQKLSGPSSINSLDWSAGPYFLNLKAAVAPSVPLTNWNADQQYVDMGTSQFWSVPFALYASKVAGFDLKLNIADTTNMLKPYLRKSDTTNLSGRIDANNTAVSQESARAVASETLKENSANKSTSIITDGSSDIKYPSVKSVKTYVDEQVFSGPQGIQGLNGLKGSTGATGSQGPIGLTGVTGADGTNGVDGATGPQGSQGFTGAIGPQGPQGITGATGAAGTNGVDGATGSQGPQGITGATGAAGTNGVDGATGSQGPQGITGVTGATGSNASISIGSIVGTSTVNAATISSGVLSLAPADETNGGIVTSVAQTFAGAKTFTAAPVLSAATASKALFTDANKNIVSNTITGTGDVVMSSSPTLTGTITAASQTISGTLGVGIVTPAASAKLDVSSTTQGFLPPRMNYYQRTQIASPVAGLTIWCSNCGVSGEMQVFNGGSWTNIIGGAATSTISLSIGDSYQGGIVAYILQSGNPGYDANTQHGLIAATTDQSAGIHWYINGSYSTTGAAGIAIGTGLANTNATISIQGAPATNYAAGLARAYNGGGYTDWFLPSIDELYQLYYNRVAIGGLASNYYWSSTEAGSGGALVMDFYSAYSLGANGSTLYFSIRSVRAF